MADENSILMLAERLLSCSQPHGAMERAQLLPDRLPRELPLGVPLPPDSSILASVDRNPGSGRRWVEVVIERESTGEDILAFYRRELPIHGWRPIPSVPHLTGETGGFPEVLPDQAHFCRGADGPHFAVFLIGATSLAKLIIRLKDTIHCGPPLPSAPRRIPPMSLQEGATVLISIGPQGGTFNHQREFWQTYVISKLRPEDLAENAEHQLRAAGWSQSSRDVTDTRLVSVWRNPKDGWEGILAVTSFGHDRYLVESFAFESDI